MVRVKSAWAAMAVTYCPFPDPGARESQLPIKGEESLDVSEETKASRSTGDRAEAGVRTRC